MPQHFDGNELRRRRHAAGIDQTRFAADIGKSAATIANYENGHYHPPVAVLTRIAQALGCRVEDLFREEAPVA